MKSTITATDTPLARFARFVAVGGFATLLQYVLLYIGVEGLHIAPVPASALGYLLSAIANYALNRRLTFRSDASHRTALPRFAIVSGTGLLLNSAIMYVGTAILSGHYLLVQIFATVLVLLWNFIGSQLWTFRQPSAN